MGLSKLQRLEEQKWWIHDFVVDEVIANRPDIDWTKTSACALVDKHKDEIINKLKEMAKDISKEAL